MLMHEKTCVIPTALSHFIAWRVITPDMMSCDNNNSKMALGPLVSKLSIDKVNGTN